MATVYKSALDEELYYRFTHWVLRNFPPPCIVHLIHLLLSVTYHMLLWLEDPIGLVTALYWCVKLMLLTWDCIERQRSSVNHTVGFRICHWEIWGYQESHGPHVKKGAWATVNLLSTDIHGSSASALVLLMVWTYLWIFLKTRITYPPHTTVFFGKFKMCITLSQLACIITEIFSPLLRMVHYFMQSWMLQDPVTTQSFLRDFTANVSTIYTTRVSNYQWNGVPLVHQLAGVFYCGTHEETWLFYRQPMGICKAPLIQWATCFCSPGIQIWHAINSIFFYLLEAAISCNQPSIPGWSNWNHSLASSGLIPISPHQSNTNGIPGSWEGLKCLGSHIQ